MSRRWIFCLAPLLLAACAVEKPYYMAEEFRRTCRYDEARELLRAKIEKASSIQRIGITLHLGTVEESAGNLPRAIELYREAVKAAGADSPYTRQAQELLGKSAVKAHDFAQGIESLDVVLDFHDQDVRRLRTRVEVPWDTRIALAVALAESRRFGEAATQFQAAEEQHPKPWLDAARTAAERFGDGKGIFRPGDFWDRAYGKEQLDRPAEKFELWPIYRVAPQYPLYAMRANTEGYVTAYVKTAEDGSVLEASVVESQPPKVFDAAALDALRKWRFLPATKDCKPVPSEGAQRIEFKMVQ